MAFNATSQVSYYYSPWQPGPWLVALPLPFSVPSGRNALSTESTWPPGPNALYPLFSSILSSFFSRSPTQTSLPLFLTLSFSGHVGLFIQWTEDQSAGFGYCFSGSTRERELEKKKKKGTCPRLGLDRGLWGSLLVFDEIHRPNDGTHCFISHESVTPLVHYDRLG